MKNLIICCITAMLLHACGLDEQKNRNRFDLNEAIENKVEIPKESDQLPEVIQNPEEVDVPNTVEMKVFQGLNKYCRSCHGVGRLRFFYTENPKDLFAYLNTEYTPKSQTLWIKAMIDVLSWPSEEIPSFESQRAPSGDWMPIGAKRNHIANDLIDGISAREYILQYLKDIEK